MSSLGLMALGLDVPTVFSSVQQFSPSLLAGLVLVAVFLALILLPSRFKHKVNGNSGDRHDEKWHDALEKPMFEGVSQAKVPTHPHLQGSYIPSSGLMWSNTKDAFPFENDNCTGSFLPLHRPTYDKELDKSGEYAYGNHFHNRKRIWEMRIQFKFKVPPKKLWFGIELEEYHPMSWTVERTQRVFVRLLQSVIGQNLYHSAGDKSGEERPVFAMPLWAFDQFLETPEGQEPPNLNTSDSDSLGMRRTENRRQFMDDLENLRFRAGPTYTFCFWGISQYLDNISWEVIWKIGRIDFNQFCGKPPVHVVLYELEPPVDGRDERHLQSRKNYFFRLAFWSSRKPPAKERQRELLGDHWNKGEEKENADRKKVSPMKALLTCCAPEGRRDTF